MLLLGSECLLLATDLLLHLLKLLLCAVVGLLGLLEITLCLVKSLFALAKLLLSGFLLGLGGSCSGTAPCLFLVLLDLFAEFFLGGSLFAGEAIIKCLHLLLLNAIESRLQLTRLTLALLVKLSLLSGFSLNDASLTVLEHRIQLLKVLLGLLLLSLVMLELRLEALSEGLQGGLLHLRAYMGVTLTWLVDLHGGIDHEAVQAFKFGLVRLL